MLSKTLQRLVDTKRTTVGELAEVGGVSTSTVYRWIAGRCQPDFETVRRLIRGLPDRRAQEALLSVITVGSGWGFRLTDGSLDMDGDGDVDVDDALDASIKAVHAAGRSLTTVRETTGDGHMRMYDLVTVIGQLNQVIQNATAVQEILIRTMEDRKRSR